MIAKGVIKAKLFQMVEERCGLMIVRGAIWGKVFGKGIRYDAMIVRGAIKESGLADDSNKGLCHIDRALDFMVPRAGVEPTTRGFPVQRANNNKLLTSNNYVEITVTGSSHV
jgi:hypothetical protein